LFIPPVDYRDKSVIENGWNDIEIECRANHIQIKVNNVVTVSWTETDVTIPLSGRLGMQVHGGSRMHVYFKNIFIEEIP
jgi:hypothetical protein